jgi:pimeloyl-ACP methyl ester carboxylesterase
MAPVGRALADGFRVLEPFQRRAGREPLTVATLVADLDQTIRGEGWASPALVGSSWGAMLALAYAATFPGRAGRLVLVGCGTFDRRARETMRETVNRRLGVEPGLLVTPAEVRGLGEDEALRLAGERLLPAYSHDLLSTETGVERCDARGHREVWADMVRLQDEGVYPGAFTRVVGPVLMLHGESDPHPGPMVRDSLAPHVRGLRYHALSRCGHYPWLERHAREEFFRVLRGFLAGEDEGPQPIEIIGG